MSHCGTMPSSPGTESERFHVKSGGIDLNLGIKLRSTIAKYGTKQVPIVVWPSADTPGGSSGDGGGDPPVGVLGGKSDPPGLFIRYVSRDGYRNPREAGR